MLDSAPVVAFVATSDAARARQFYEGVLGLRLVADEPVALVFDARGTMLRVTKVGEVRPAPYTVLGWIVPGASGAVAALAAKGVSFERFEGLDQDAAGVWTAPDGARVAWFRDPDGNLLSLTAFPGREGG